MDRLIVPRGAIRSHGPQTMIPYQISQRADHIVNDFFEWVQQNRAIVNTRDEPLADPNQYRRIHLLLGDSNMAEVATALKMGTTGLVLQLIEEGKAPAGVELDEPVETLVHARARLIDVVLREIWPRKLDGHVVDWSLVAVGGYGRSELPPYSDVDLLILVPTLLDDAGPTGATRLTLRYAAAFPPDLPPFRLCFNASIRLTTLSFLSSGSGILIFLPAALRLTSAFSAVS